MIKALLLKAVSQLLFRRIFEEKFLKWIFGVTRRLVGNCWLKRDLLLFCWGFVIIAPSFALFSSYDNCWLLSLNCVLVIMGESWNRQNLIILYSLLFRRGIIVNRRSIEFIVWRFICILILSLYLLYLIHLMLKVSFDEIVNQLQVCHNCFWFILSFIFKLHYLHIRATFSELLMSFTKLLSELLGYRNYLILKVFLYLSIHDILIVLLN